ncbi:hypothetical protein SAMN05421858_2214 [Haladaptatus litoreus]|uniref:DUF7835 domain-containing protein n=2 Tax=Haladaptatus litoreus TaxID=553468 RepID=A0A1N6ZX49_9EURY|nr:hypothetical protein SAMN05421858_2214 [Haladaptatus litoreus]
MLVSAVVWTEQEVTMATKNQGFQAMVELCDNCGRETSHEVSVEIRTESKKRENAEFSREPYRITTCQTCGEEKSQRMNNA